MNKKEQKSIVWFINILVMLYYGAGTGTGTGGMALSLVLW